MANDFKNGIKVDVGTNAIDVYTVPPAKASILIEVDVANTHTSAITAGVKIYDSATGGSPATATAWLVKDAPIPVGGTLQAIAGQKIVLETGDKVQVVSSVANSADVVCSILEDVNS